MTRLEALEKVAEAAREHFLSRRIGAWGELRDALRDLDALAAFRAAAKPEGETVTLAVWKARDGRVLWSRAGSRSDAAVHFGADFIRLGTVTLPLDKEPGHAE